MVMSLGINLTPGQFKAVIPVLKPRDKKDLLKVYKRYSKVLFEYIF